MKHHPGDYINDFLLLDRQRVAPKTVVGTFLCKYCDNVFPSTLGNIHRRKSCGCQPNAPRESLLGKRAPNYCHGYTGTKLHNKWRGMKARCTHTPFYRAMGYDPAWDLFEDWLEYVTAIPSYPGDLAIEQEDWHLHRPDNSKGYFRDNMEWLTAEDHINIHLKYNLYAQSS